jgi:ketosteroid isomerase-like protein
MNMRSATTRIPPDASRAFRNALNRGDLEAASACFARHGCLITADATAVHGRERVRPLLAQLIARQTRIEADLSSAVVAGDVIVIRERWLLSTSGTEDARIEQMLTATLAVSRVEGEWKLAIVAPWGWGAGVG